jgi:hypothetical protein
MPSPCAPPPDAGSMPVRRRNSALPVRRRHRTGSCSVATSVSQGIGAPTPRECCPLPAGSGRSAWPISGMAATGEVGGASLAAFQARRLRPASALPASAVPAKRGTCRRAIGISRDRDRASRHVSVASGSAEAGKPCPACSVQPAKAARRPSVVSASGYEDHHDQHEHDGVPADPHHHAAQVHIVYRAWPPGPDHHAGSTQVCSGLRLACSRSVMGWLSTSKGGATIGLPWRVSRAPHAPARQPDDGGRIPRGARRSVERSRQAGPIPGRPREGASRPATRRRIQAGHAKAHPGRPREGASRPATRRRIQAGHAKAHPVSRRFTVV